MIYAAPCPAAGRPSGARASINVSSTTQGQTLVAEQATTGPAQPVLTDTATMRGPLANDSPEPVQETAAVWSDDCSEAEPEIIEQRKCVSKYISCLKQDSVCGEHFEACDSQKRFSQKHVMCHDRLTECPDAGIQQLYGTPVESKCRGAERNFTPALTTLAYSAATDSDCTNGSDIGNEICKGVDYIIQNADATCKAAIDNCVKKNCRAAPMKCVGAVNVDSADYADISTKIIGDNSYATIVGTYIGNAALDESNSNIFIRAACKAESATNACYMMVNGKTPNDDLWTIDDFEITTTYEAIMTGQNGLLAANKDKIKDWAANVIGAAIENCKTSATDCAKSACGSGSLAACYGQAVSEPLPSLRCDDADITDKKPNIQNISNIESTCKGQINNNQNCVDLFGEEPWSKVWGSSNTSDDGEFGLITQLNCDLAGMFTQNVLDSIELQCKSEAESCVRRECGTNFTNCYLDDVRKAARPTDTNYGKDAEHAAGGFDQKMAMNLCLIPVKRSDACQNYFDISYMRGDNNKSAANSWSDAWITKGNQSRNQWENQCTVDKTYNKQDDKGIIADTVDNSFKTIATLDNTTQAMTNEACAEAERTIFDNLIAEVAQKAKETITAAQTAAQTACKTSRGNTSGSMHYMWVEKPDDVPDDYSIMGLGTQKKDAQTADLWGAFCQVRVEIAATDPKIQDLFKDPNAHAAYFSLGDAVMCGSWLKTSVIDKITEMLGSEAADKVENGRKYDGLITGVIAGLGGGALGAGLGVMGGAAIDKSNRDNGPAGSDIRGALERLDQFEGDVNAARTTLVNANSSDKFIKGGYAAKTWDGLSGVSGALHLYSYAADANGKISHAKVLSDLDGIIKKIGQAREKLNAKMDSAGKESSGWQTGLGIGGGIVGGLGGIASGFMVNAAVEKEHEINQLIAKDAAAKKFLNEIGGKIKCTVAGKVIGGYGSAVVVK